jgi:HSP20 family protein
MDDLWGGFGLAPAAFTPRDDFLLTLDAVELENEYRVTAEVPGVEPADLEIAVEDGVLTIKGQRHYEDETSEAGEVTRVDERGRFERRIRFPGEIVEGDVKAVCKNGVVTVTIPKPEQVKPEVRSIPVETA